MAIVVTCGCGRKLQVREEFAGREGQCPACGGALHIPGPEAEPPAAPAADPAPEAPRNAWALTPDTRPADPARKAAPTTEGAEREGPFSNHGGGPIPPDADFFADSPPEIGPLASAHTTLRHGQEPWSPGGRLAVLALSAAVGLAVSAAAVQLTGAGRSSLGPALLVCGATVFLAVLIAAVATRFRHTCSYVGREGVASFACAGRRGRVVGRKVFCFRDAAELRTAQTEQYVNGAYAGTNWRFAWSDVGGRPRFVLRGTHRDKGEPPPADPYHFARAAEMAWTYYLLGQAGRQVELAGAVLFTLSGRKWIRLGPGVLSADFGQGPVEWPAAEIAGASVQQGVVRIIRRDAREGWLSSTGVLKFNFAELANAQLFFHLLVNLVGVPVNEAAPPGVR
jgi:hypothetical protein